MSLDRSAHLNSNAAVTDGGIRFFKIGIVIIVAANVAGKLGFFFLFEIRANDRVLNEFSRSTVDRVGNVGVELGAAGPIFIEAVTALITEPGPQVVFATTIPATVGELATGHGNEHATGAFDDFQITDNKSIVERNRAEREQTLVVLFAEFDADFRDDHRRTPLRLGTHLGVKG